MFSQTPEPVDRLTWIDDGEANELFTIVVCSEIQRHFLNQALNEHRSINDAQYRIIEAFQMVFCFYFVILQPIYKDES